ncbi:MAG: glycosyltransferase [Marinifilaceae bacterium]
MKKSILFIMPSLKGGGAEKVLIDLLCNFDYNKYDVTLLLFYNKGVYLPQLPQQVRKVYLFEDRHFKLLSRIMLKCNSKLGWDVFLRNKLNALNLPNFDVVVSFLEGISVALHDIIWDKGKKHISWVHIDLLVNHWSDDFFTKGKENCIYNKMDNIVFVSKDALLQFERLFPMNTAPKSVMYNPILKESIVKRGSEQIVNTDAFTITTVGRIAPQKAYDRIIRVAKILKDSDQNVKFWILGEGKLRTSLEKLAKEFKVDDIVEFKGFHLNPYPYIVASDMFISTSISEGYSLVIGEALCLGKPIVSTKTTGPVELLENGAYGILTEHDDHSIANGVMQLLADNERLEYFRQKSIERANIFDINTTMNELYQIIN